MTDFLLEIFSEEIPAKMQKNAVQNFATIALETLIKAGLQIKDQQIKTYISPRRLVLYIDELSLEQKVAAVKKIGPKINADKKAIEGFLRANNLNSEDQLEKIDNNGSLCYLYQKPETSSKTLNIIQSSLPIILQKMIAAWPKIMRFDTVNGQQAKWIRAIRNILCIFGSEIVDFEFAGLNSTNLTYGHLLGDNKALKIDHPQNYINILRDNFVIVDHQERKQKIISQINHIKDSLQLQTVDEEDKSPLFDEVVGLCEWPCALIGNIDEKFMHLPPEVLILTLKLNQKYFCLKENNGCLSTKFIFISNALKDEKSSEKIIFDNQKIVRARLQDASFFVEEDLKHLLINKVSELKNIVFHNKLGSIFDRIERLENLGETLSLWIPHCDIALVERAANLCKADLITKIVAEMPELQGKIGSYYAAHQNENYKICTAIYEHYLPLGPNSDLPVTPLGIALAIADKIDIIVGLFLANEKPTSSKDPFALRRAALGIIRMSFVYNINLPLKVLVAKSLKLYKPKLLGDLLEDQIQDKNSRQDQKQTLIDEIIKFMFERLKNFLKENRQIRADVVNAVVDDYINNIETRQYCDILIIARKAAFLNDLVYRPENIVLIQLYKRCANVLSIEEKRDGRKYDDNPTSIILKDEYEKSLYHMIKKIAPEFNKLASKGDFGDAFKLLMLLEKPLAQFFDNVIVNDKNKKLRENRLLLLSKIRALFGKVADLSRIEL